MLCSQSLPRMIMLMPYAPPVLFILVVDLDSRIKSIVHLADRVAFAAGQIRRRIWSRGPIPLGCESRKSTCLGPSTFQLFEWQIQIVLLRISTSSCYSIVVVVLSVASILVVASHLARFSPELTFGVLPETFFLFHAFWTCWSWELNNLSPETCCVDIDVWVVREDWIVR
jgi:hypothetical protein